MKVSTNNFNNWKKLSEFFDIFVHMDFQQILLKIFINGLEQSTMSMENFSVIFFVYGTLKVP